MKKAIKVFQSWIGEKFFLLFLGLVFIAEVCFFYKNRHEFWEYLNPPPSEWRIVTITSRTDLPSQSLVRDDEWGLELKFSDFEEITIWSFNMEPEYEFLTKKHKGDRLRYRLNSNCAWGKQFDSSFQ